MQLILLGPPGSGKGTLAKDLSEMYHIPHISTGDIFRKMIREKTPLGQEADRFISKGQLVPDQVTISMVSHRLKQDDCADGFMFDGFPRTIPQAEALDQMMREMGRQISAVFNVMVSDDLILYRLTGRRICSGCGSGFNVNTMPPETEGICDHCGKPLIQREDDQPGTIRKRLETYKEETQPLIEYYDKLNLIVEVDNSGKIGENLEDVDRDLKKKLGELKSDDAAKA